MGMVLVNQELGPGYSFSVLEKIILHGIDLAPQVL